MLAYLKNKAMFKFARKSIQQEKETAAINLLKMGLSLEIVPQGTGLTIEDIKKIQSSKE